MDVMKSVLAVCLRRHVTNGVLSWLPLNQRGTTGDQRATPGPRQIVTRPAKLFINVLLVKTSSFIFSLRRTWNNKLLSVYLLWVTLYCIPSDGRLILNGELRMIGGCSSICMEELRKTQKKTSARTVTEPGTSRALGTNAKPRTATFGSYRWRNLSWHLELKQIRCLRSEAFSIPGLYLRTWR
jgi:hypothetical protein